MNEFISMIAKNAARANRPEEGDYTGEDGLLYCGKCHTRKQHRLSGSGIIVPCMCRCKSDEYDRKKAEENETQERINIRQLKSECIQDRKYSEMCFANAIDSPLIRKAKEFVAQWDEIYKSGTGLLLWGDTDGGKTFTAMCIGNALIEKGIPVLMTSFPLILSADIESRGEILSSIGRYNLLIIDDLGAEHQSEYAVSTMFAIIDARVRSQKPMILTSNLDVRQLQNPSDIGHKRIYERIREVCVPVHVEKAGYRQEKSRDRRALIERIFGGVK